MLSEGERQWLERPAACTEPAVRVSWDSTALPPESSISVCSAQVAEIPESPPSSPASEICLELWWELVGECAIPPLALPLWCFLNYNDLSHLHPMISFSVCCDASVEVVQNNGLHLHSHHDSSIYTSDGDYCSVLKIPFFSFLVIFLIII